MSGRSSGTTVNIQHANKVEGAEAEAMKQYRQLQENEMHCQLLQQ
jgi:hypothetical protein